MSIREKIGQRIFAARKKAGFSVQEVADRTKSLKQRRISNYEQGIRTPGPDEILQLADVLQVSPAYLMCLSDEENKPTDLSQHLGEKIVPVLSLEEALNYETIVKRPIAENLATHDHLRIDSKNANNLDKLAFAIEIDDDSMKPNFTMGDVVVFNPTKKALPGKIVLARLADSPKACVRLYREPGTVHVGKSEFELVPFNSDWPTKIIRDAQEGKILGTLVEHRHYSKR